MSQKLLLLLVILCSVGTAGCDRTAAPATQDAAVSADAPSADAPADAIDASSDVTLADAATTDTAAGPTVYELLGKKPGIRLFLDVFFKEMSWGPILSFYLPPQGSPELTTLKDHMADVLAIIWGCGDCSYAGNLDMAAVHKGVMVAEGEWNAFTGLTYEVMNEELLLPNETIIAAVQALEAYKGKIVDTTSLYGRFGGRIKVRKVVGQLFTTYIPKDPLLKPRFAGAPQPQLADAVTDYIAGQVLGQKFVHYQGKAPGAAHAGMKITAAEMDKFMELLGKSMDDFTVNPQAKAELLALLAKDGAGLIGK